MDICRASEKSNSQLGNRRGSVYGKECAACGRKNHFARMYTQKTSKKQEKPRPGKKQHTKKSVHDVNDYSSSSDYEYVLTVEEVHSVS